MIRIKEKYVFILIGVFLNVHLQMNRIIYVIKNIVCFKFKRVELFKTYYNG
jgi:hypothetical protein